MEKTLQVREADGVKVAQRFIAGSCMEKTLQVREADGRMLDDFGWLVARFAGLIQSNLLYPALKCWAIFSRPLRGR